MHPHLNRKRQQEHARRWDFMKDALFILFLAPVGAILTWITFAIS